MKKRIESDEIDLIEIIINIWKNKLKVAAITLFFITLSTSLYFIKKHEYIAITEIQPISIFELEKYRELNSLIKKYQDYQINQNNLNNQNNQNSQNSQNSQNNEYRFDQIQRNYLVSLFIEALIRGEVLKNAFKEFEIIDQEKFENVNDYLDEIEKETSKVNLLQPFNIDGSIKDEEIKLNWTIEYSTKNIEKWEEILKYINKKINNEVKKYLVSFFDYNIQDLRSIKSYELQDIKNKIKFAKDDYEIETSNKLSFLKEQAAIARKMKIASNLDIINSTLQVEVLEYNKSSTVISNTQTTNPYYLRGFEVIDKEIELIENRPNKDAFTKGLLDLEKEKRKLEENKFLERLELKLSNTPIKNDNDLVAANIKFQGTQYQTSSNLINTILIAGIIGVIFGIFYVLISSAINKRK